MRGGSVPNGWENTENCFTGSVARGGKRESRDAFFVNGEGPDPVARRQKRHASRGIRGTAR